MPYNTDINRSDVSTLIREEYAPQIFKGTVENSVVMRQARRLPAMPAEKTNMPVLSLLPSAYFVDGDSGRKQTTEVRWQNKQLVAKELAVIVPVPEAVIEDSSYDIWGEVSPLLGEAFGKAFDQAVLFGTNAPAGWPSDLLTGATAAGNTVALGTGADIYEDVLGESGVVSAIEADGYIPNGYVADVSLRGKLRSARDAEGRKLFENLNMIDENPVFYPRNGSMNPASALLFAGDWSQLVFAMRKDLTFKVLDQAVIDDGAGNILYNLAQQDMVALRAVMRLAWQLPNPVNRLEETEGDRYPFGVLLPAS